jgi:ParB-like chromosome segregation protein Spo0J
MTTTNTPGIVKRGSNRVYADPRLIGVDPAWNSRFDLGDVVGLARDILDEYRKAPETGGLLHDIRVERGGLGAVDGNVFTLVDGQRRLTAIRLLLSDGVDGSGPIAFEHGVPIKLEAAGTPVIDKLLRMYKANGGKPFLPLEEADAFRRLRADEVVDGKVIRKGLTIAQIEEATGKSDNYIVGSLALLDADASLVEAVKSGAISANVGKSIAVNARGDKAAQAELATEAKAAGKDKVKRRAVLKKIEAKRVEKATKKGLKLKMRALDDQDLSKLGEKVARLLASKAVESGFLKLGVAIDDQAIAGMGAKCAADPALAAAFTFGALQALKAAAGLKISLDI